MADSIKTVSDMFRAIEQEIADVKAGTLPLDTARVVQRGRSLQLKTAELNLQFQRINKSERRGDKEFNLLTGSAVPIDDVSKENRPV